MARKRNSRRRRDNERSTVTDDGMNIERNTVTNPGVNNERNTETNFGVNNERNTVPNFGVNIERSTVTNPGMNIEENTECNIDRMIDELDHRARGSRFTEHFEELNLDSEDDNSPQVMMPFLYPPPRSARPTASTMPAETHSQDSHELLLLEFSDCEVCESRADTITAIGEANAVGYHEHDPEYDIYDRRHPLDSGIEEEENEDEDEDLAWQHSGDEDEEDAEEDEIPTEGEHLDIEELFQSRQDTRSEQASNPQIPRSVDRSTEATNTASRGNILAAESSLFPDISPRLLPTEAIAKPTFNTLLNHNITVTVVESALRSAHSRRDELDEAIKALEKERLAVNNQVEATEKEANALRIMRRECLATTGISPELHKEWLKFCDFLKPENGIRNGFFVLCEGEHHGSYIHYNPGLDIFRDAVNGVLGGEKEVHWNDCNYRCEAFVGPGPAYENEVFFFPIQAPIMDENENCTWGDCFPKLYELVISDISRNISVAAVEMLLRLPDRDSPATGWLFEYELQPRLAARPVVKGAQIISDWWTFRAAHNIEEPATRDEKFLKFAKMLERFRSVAMLQRTRSSADGAGSGVDAELD